MAANPAQLLLLADHIKLSLLERQRAITLKLQPNSQNGEISRSLEALRDGLEKLEDNEGLSQDSQRQTASLRRQYDELYSQFTGSNPTSRKILTSPNNSSLTDDFSDAQNRPRMPISSSSLKRPNDKLNGKSVRFSDSPNPEEEANRAALFPYKDDPDTPPDHAALDNQQVHEYHSQVIRDQDEQLDRLGESIGRQREISLRIGDELDEQMEMLDDVDEGVNRHQSQLDRATKRLNNVAKKAKDNMSLTIILFLIVILILLIVILK